MVGPAGAGNVGFPTVGEGLVPSRSSSDPVPCPLPTDGRLYEAFSRRNARPYEARAVPCAIPNSEFPAFSPLFSSFTPYHIFGQKSSMKFGLSVLLCALPKLIHDNRTKIRDFPGFFLTSFRLKFTIEARTRRMPCPCPPGLLPGNARRYGASCRAMLGAAGWIVFRFQISVCRRRGSRAFPIPNSELRIPNFSPLASPTPKKGRCAHGISTQLKLCC